jgi:hypothetical protein
MFQDLEGTATLWAKLGEMHADSSNVLAVPDPREVVATASELSQIDWVMMIQIRLGSDIEFCAVNLVNEIQENVPGTCHDFLMALTLKI